MIKASDILAVKTEKMFRDLKVKKVGDRVYYVIGYYYGEEEVKLLGNAEDVARFINGYYGLGYEMKQVNKVKYYGKDYNVVGEGVGSGGYYILENGWQVPKQECEIQEYKLV